MPHPSAPRRTHVSSDSEPGLFSPGCFECPGEAAARLIKQCGAPRPRPPVAAVGPGRVYRATAPAVWNMDGRTWRRGGGEAAAERCRECPWPNGTARGWARRVPEHVSDFLRDLSNDSPLSQAPPGARGVRARGRGPAAKSPPSVPGRVGIRGAPPKRARQCRWTERGHVKWLARTP